MNVPISKEEYERLARASSIIHDLAALLKIGPDQKMKAGEYGPPCPQSIRVSNAISDLICSNESIRAKIKSIRGV